MSSAITNVGQTRINQLRGEELPLVIDRMVLALIPGLDPTLAVDRSQQMPDPGDIVHTAIIDADHKGYVDPDQVVYSIILGSDVGDFSFNWIGLIEAVTDTVIAITTTPETPKRATNLATNTTGNNITRNFMIAFQDAQNLTGVTVAAETWQFDYQAEFSGHEMLVVDPTQEGADKKHVTDSQAKVWQDHVGDQIHTRLATENIAGLIELAADAEAQGLVANDKAITPATLDSAFKGANQSEGAPRYQRLPGGFILQIGNVINSATPTVSTLVTFPIAFPTVCFGVLISNRYSSASGISFAATAETKTGFSSTCSAANAGAVWFALGK